MTPNTRPSNAGSGSARSEVLGRLSCEVAFLMKKFEPAATEHKAIVTRINNGYSLRDSLIIPPSYLPVSTPTDASQPAGLKDSSRWPKRGEDHRKPKQSSVRTLKGCEILPLFQCDLAYSRS